MNRIQSSFFIMVLSVFANNCTSMSHTPPAKHKTQIVCTIGNENSKPGPGFLSFRTLHKKPSSTTVQIFLGDFWKERGFQSSALTQSFQYGIEFSADFLRKHALWDTESRGKTDQEVLKMQMESPSSIDFRVNASLQKGNAVEVYVERKLRAMDGPVSGVEQVNQKIVIPEAQFGKPFVMLEDSQYGAVGVVCQGQF